MIKSRLALATAAFLVCSALPAMPAIADSSQDCKDRFEALRDQRTNDPDLAIEACTNFLATAQEDQVAQEYQFRALAYFYKHDFYHAVKDFSVVIKVRPDFQAAYIYRGLAYEYQTDDDAAFADLAISDLDMAARLQGDVYNQQRTQFWLAYQMRAFTNLQQGNDGQAVADMDKAVELNPDKVVAIKAGVAIGYQRRALQRLASGQYNEAVDAFQQAIQLDPTTADKLTPYRTEAQSRKPGPYSAIARGDQRYDNQEYEQALNNYSEAVQANPNLAEAYLRRGSAYQALDQFDDALADFEEAIRLDQNNWFAFYVRGKLYQSMDHFDEAAEDFDQAAATIERVHDSGYDAEKSRMDDARKSLEFSRTIEDHWISYLKEIQAANTHLNWLDAPYNLYLKQHSLNAAGQIAANPSSPSSASPPTSPEPATTDTDGSPWVPWLFLLVVVVVGCGAFILYRRR